MVNPPFGGKERKEVQQDFPIRTGETAFLFLQRFMKVLKPGGRAGVIIKNTFLSNTDNASVRLRKQLLESCNLHTVLDCPGGTFLGAGVNMVVLFVEKGSPTRKVWHYQLDPGRNMGKTNPLNDNDLAEFVESQRTFANSPEGWSVDASGIDQTTFDLSVKNPEDGANLLARATSIAFPASGKYWVNNHAYILKFEDMATQRFVEHFLEGIATAKANAEKNHQNARALFESHLQSVFTQRGDG